jgi:bacillithiol system protein YtxJ
MRALVTLADLDAAVERSHVRPIVIFKHSATCGKSVMAFHEMEDFVAGAPAADVFMASVQSAARVTTEIASRFRVRHESPQALLVDRGVVAWHGSHFRVNRERLVAALAALAPPPVDTAP